MEYRIFGCKTNKYFTDKWMAAPGFASKPGIFVASCVVTENAKRKWKRFVKKAVGELEEGGKVYVSGCGSISEGKVSARFYEEYPDLFPFRDKIELLGEDPDDSAPFSAKSSVTTPMERVRSLSVALSKSNLFTRKYSVVQTGCDNRCTFCLTVAAR
jgi:tRNA A37 methylthiotransferase MiaB